MLDSGTRAPVAAALLIPCPAIRWPVSPWPDIETKPATTGGDAASGMRLAQSGRKSEGQGEECVIMREGEFPTMDTPRSVQNLPRQSALDAEMPREGELSWKVIVENRPLTR